MREEKTDKTLFIKNTIKLYLFKCMLMTLYLV